LKLTSEFFNLSVKLWLHNKEINLSWTEAYFSLYIETYLVSNFIGFNFLSRIHCPHLCPNSSAPR